jgi:DNA polymerase-3 subunit delta'
MLSGKSQMPDPTGGEMAFRDILGQEHAVSLLHKALVSTRLSHAYLFYGPTGVGKKLTALQFAQAVVCLAASPEACDTCSACHKVGTGNHPDVVLISPEGTSIRIEHIRALQRQLSYKPYESPRTVIILDGCESLTPPAANALLKTLEEPPASALLLLLTGKKDALPLTIISRCQQIPFRPLAPAHIRTILMRQGMDQSTAAIAATLAEGRLDTWMHTDVQQALTRRHSAYALLHSKGQTQQTPLFLFARQCAGSRDQCEELLHWLSLLCRDLVMLHVAPTLPLYNHDLRSELAALAHTLSVGCLTELFGLLEQLRHYLTMNANPQLTFERLVIQLQQLLDMPRASSA